MYSIDLKNKAVLMYLQKGIRSFRQLQFILDIGKSTLHRWIYTHPVLRNNHSKRKNSLLCKANKNLSDYLSKNPFCTCFQIIQYLKKVLNISTSQSTVCRTIKKMGWVQKIPTTTVTINPNFEIPRQLFSENIKKINKNDIISIDESHFYIRSKPNKGRSACQKRKNFIKIIRNRKQKITPKLNVKWNSHCN
jgi:arginine repressor